MVLLIFKKNLHVEAYIIIVSRTVTSYTMYLFMGHINETLPTLRDFCCHACIQSVTVGHLLAATAL